MKRKWIGAGVAAVLIVTASVGIRHWRARPVPSGDLALTVSTEELVRMMEKGSGDQRREAALAAGRKGDPAAVGPLLALLRDPEEGIRREAIRALGLLHDPRAVEPLMGMARDPARMARMEAAIALGRIPDPRSIDVLGELMKDPEWTVRQAAVNALAVIGGPEAVPLLSQAAGDEHHVIRQAALKALAAKDSPPLAGAAPAGDPAAEVDVLSLMKDPDFKIRGAAIKTIPPGRLDLTEALFRLVAEDPSEHVRAVALAKLAQQATISEPVQVRYLDACGVIIRREQVGSSTRWETLQRLKGSAHPHLPEVLVDLVKDPDQEVRKAAESVFGSARPAGGERLLLPLLAHTNREVRATVVRCLVSYQADPAVREVLAREPVETNSWAGLPSEAPSEIKNGMPADLFLKQAQNWDPRVREAAIGDMYRWKDDPRVTDCLLESLKDEDEEVVVSAMRILAGRKEPRAVEPVRALIGSDIRRIRERALHYFKALDREEGIRLQVEGLKTLSPEERRSWANSFLNTAPTPAEQERLIGLLQDPDFAVAADAAEMLQRRGKDDLAQPALEALAVWTERLKKGVKSECWDYGHDGEIVQRLAEIVGQNRVTNAVPFLIGNLSAACERARLGAVLALGQIGDPRAINPLIVAMSDRDPEVRAGAVASLGNFTDPVARDAVKRASMDENAGVAEEAYLGRMKQAASVADSLDLFLGGLKRGAGCRQYAFLRMSEEPDPARLKVLFDSFTAETDSKLKMEFMRRLAVLSIPEARAFVKRELAALDAKSQRTFLEPYNRLSDPVMIDYFMPFLSSTNPALLQMADWKISSCSSVMSVEQIAEYANDPDEPVRFWVASSLDRRKETNVLALLRKLADDPSLKVAGRAIESMGKSEAKANQAMLMELAGLPPRERAVKALLSMREGPDARGLAFLLKLVEGDDPELRLAALNPLARSRSAAKVEPLLGVLAKGVPAERAAAVRGLVGQKDPRIKPAMLGLAADPDPEVRRQCLTALGVFVNEEDAGRALMEGLKDTNELVRAEAGYQAAKREGSNTVDQLAPFLADPSERVRLMTGRGLWERKSDDGRKRVLDFLPRAPRADRLAFCGALSKTHREELFPFVIDQLKEPDADYRQQMVSRLFSLIALTPNKEQFRKGVDTLAALLDDPEEPVRKAARTHLGFIGQMVPDAESKRYAEAALKGKKAMPGS